MVLKVVSVVAQGEVVVKVEVVNLVVLVQVEVAVLVVVITVVVLAVKLVFGAIKVVIEVSCNRCSKSNSGYCSSRSSGGKRSSSRSNSNAY